MRSRHNRNGLKVLVLGLDSAGKTTLVKMAYNYCASGLTRPLDCTILPTAVPEVTTLVHKASATRIQFIDAGGSGRFRCMWYQYLEGADCVLYAIDSQDTGRLMIAKEELEVLLKNCGKSAMRFLVVATKSCASGSFRASKIADTLNLKQVLRSYTWTALEFDGTSERHEAMLEGILGWIVSECATS